MELPRAVRRAAGFVIDGVAEQSIGYRELMKFRDAAIPDLMNFDGPPRGPADEALLQVIRAIQPFTGSNLELVRIGGSADGGYVMADMFNVKYAISLGVGPDVSWDVAVGSRGIKVSMFDPTVSRPPERVPNGTFFKTGVDDGRGNNPDFRGLKQLLRMAKVPSNEDFLLKVDVEGAEWAALDAAPELLGNATQIVMEGHWLSDLNHPDKSRSITSVLENISKTHYSIHVHANNCVLPTRLDSYWFPDVIEISYVRKDLLENPRKAQTTVTELDAPCDTRFSEINLDPILLVH